MSKCISKYKCINCGEIIEKECNHDFGMLISEFVEKGVIFGRYYVNRNYMYLHKCNDGCVGNCIPISYKLIEEEEE